MEERCELAQLVVAVVTVALAELAHGLDYGGQGGRRRLVWRVGAVGLFQRCDGPRGLLHRLVDQPDRQLECEQHLHEFAHALARQPHAQAQKHHDGRQARAQQPLLAEVHPLPRLVVARAVGAGRG